MKRFLKLILPCFIIFSVLGCLRDDDQLTDLSLDPPTDLGATFEITQDNSGLVTIIPTGEGAVLYTIDFGDGTPATEKVKIGERIDHIYEEGTYDVVITGYNLNGGSAMGSQPLTVSFLAPTNLEAVITQDPADNYTVSVSASAENAAMFHVFFGESEDEEPVPLMIGETINYTYSDIGTYTIRVVALSGGAATTEVSQEVVISDPLLMPITFESPTKNYTFFNFGGGEGAGVPVVDNPEKNEINSSDRVASYTKVAGSEVWAGTTIALAEPIDFSTEKYISLDVWSPIEGAQVIFKVENLDNADIFIEATTNTTTSEQWETLTFDMSAADPAIEYGRIVLFFNFGVPGTGETYYFDNIKTTKLEQLVLPLDFESQILTYTWAGFGGASGSVIDNPVPSGINSSSKVTQLIKSSGAQTWAGISLDLDESLDLSTSTTVKMKVFSPAAGTPVLLKFEDSGSPLNNGTPSVFVEVLQSTTKDQEWEELFFDLSGYANFDPAANYDRVIVFYDFGNPGEGSSFYFDDISLFDPVPGVPSSAAPAPSLPAENVISLFSDAYTSVTVDTWRTGWSAATLEETSVSGNAVKKYSDLDFVGIETTTSPIDATSMTHFHTDIWTADLTTFRIKLVDFGANGVFDGGGDDVEHEIVISNPEQNKWISLDIPLSEFTGLTTRAHIAQFIYSGAPAGSGTVYIDNVYFHN